MNLDLLRKHLQSYKKSLDADPQTAKSDLEEREERSGYYRSWTAQKILRMSEEDLYQYLAKLWAMLIWGNKKYKVDKIVADNGLDTVRQALANLVWGSSRIGTRWDSFRKEIKGMGPATMSEILAHTHPDEFMVWNRRAFVGLDYLSVAGLPRYDYQLNGKKFKELCDVGKEIGAEMQQEGLEYSDLLAVDYFIWAELQVEENLNRIHKGTKAEPAEALTAKGVAELAHNDVRDKLAEIGEWLGFTTRTEVKVADGSKVDTVWEATIGNMGRVIYVFEVQSRGSIDSLILNLLKALNNPAVQGVVAVSDHEQIGRIRRHAGPVKPLNDKLRCWDYIEVLDIHEALQGVNEAINRLHLVPEGF